MKHNIDTFINDLLHIDSISSNKLLDLNSSEKEKTYFLFSDDRENNACEILKIIASRIGKLGNTVLRGSALANEQLVGSGNALDWQDAEGNKNPKELDKFIKEVRKELDLKGSNPLFLGVGAINWRLAPKAMSSDVKDVKTPLLIFPIRLIQSVSTRPIMIEFVDDTICVNPCFIAKLVQIYGESVLSDFPLPDSSASDLSEPIRTDLIGSLSTYLEQIREFVDKHRIGRDTLFNFEKNTVAIAKYNHDEICMYYDIQRHKENIYSSKLVERLFSIGTDGNSIPQVQHTLTNPYLIMDHDSNQERIIKRVMSGESLVIKGPPGTGKTLTIANMIAALLAEGKKVMLVSKKLAALSEVYRKMPEELRDFLMLLDCETETQAANLSPTKIKTQFSSLLHECATEANLSQTFYDDYRHEQDERSLAIRWLSEYFEETFLDKKINIHGNTYYEALDLLLKNEGLETVEFTSAQTAASLTHEQVNELKSAVSDAQEHFIVLCGKGEEKHTVFVCPYFSFSQGIPNSELAIAENEKLKLIASKVVEEVEKLCIPASLSIENIMTLIAVKAKQSDVHNVINSSSGIIDRLRTSYDEIVNSSNAEEQGKVIIKNNADVKKLLDSINSLKIDKSISCLDLELLFRERKLLSAISTHNEKALKDSIIKISELKKSIALAEEKMLGVFKSGLNSSEIKKIDLAYKALGFYKQNAISEPRIFDFSAKKAYSNLCELSYLSSPTFTEIVNATSYRYEQLNLESLINEEFEKLSRLLRVNVSQKEFEVVSRLLELSNGCGKTVSLYFNEFLLSYESVQSVLSYLNVDESVSLSEVHDALELNEKIDSLCDSLEDFYSCTETNYKKSSNENKYTDLSLNIAMARKILAVYDFAFHKDIRAKSEEEIVEALELLSSGGDVLFEKTKALLLGFKSFGENVFPNYYSEFPHWVTFKDLRIFISESTDRNVLYSAERYLAYRSINNSGISLANFFKPFENGKRDLLEHSFVDVFEHSVTELALRAAMTNITNRNGRRRSYLDAISRYINSEENLKQLNVKRIRNSIIKKIDAKDPIFSFLNLENDNINNLRRIFKLYASAILKLKSCFLLSPSTVSVLFENPEFAKFDVAIVDEASQLEPTSIIPVLIRTKQCVFVGDEYQMPPISHFAAKSEHTVDIEGADSIILPPETSLLSLATQSNHFDVERLMCHFRSKTETLIAFSQKRFYPFMRTFPAAVPKARGLGFTDIYIEDGQSVGGENDREARAVITELYKHFDNYYDEFNGVLSESVGVVAFGEAQINLIKKYVEKNIELKRKIDTAISNYNDLAEKLIFFKTVETVQGQEIDHLILSFTYSNGNSFGDLSKRSISGCIFNVAVTRAKMSITMIHSILYTQTTNEIVRDFLELSERYSADGTTQFVSRYEPNNFINSVKRFILEEMKISEDRVIVGFGVTEGSIKIPLVILSEDLQCAKIGIFCELPYDSKCYIDEVVRYYSILQSRGWNLYRLNIHDWVDNQQAEKESLKNIITQAIS